MDGRMGFNVFINRLDETGSMTIDEAKIRLNASQVTNKRKNMILKAMHTRVARQLKREWIRRNSR